MKTFITKNQYEEELEKEIKKEQKRFEEQFDKQAIDVAKQENAQEFDAGFIMGLKHAKRLLNKEN